MSGTEVHDTAIVIARLVGWSCTTGMVLGMLYGVVALVLGETGLLPEPVAPEASERGSGSKASGLETDLYMRSSI